MPLAQGALLRVSLSRLHRGVRSPGKGGPHHPERTLGVVGQDCTQEFTCSGWRGEAAIRQIFNEMIRRPSHGWSGAQNQNRSLRAAAMRCITLWLSSRGQKPMDWSWHYKILCSTDLCSKQAAKSHWFPWKSTSGFFLCEETVLNRYERIQIKYNILWWKWRNSQYNLPSDSSLQLLLFSKGGCGFSLWLCKIPRALCHDM